MFIYDKVSASIDKRHMAAEQPYLEKQINDTYVRKSVITFIDWGLISMEFV